LHIFASDQIKEESNKKQLLNNFLRFLEQLVEGPNLGSEMQFAVTVMIFIFISRVICTKKKEKIFGLAKLINTE